MHPTTQLQYVLPALVELTEGIEPDQLGNPTPCARFDVHDVLAHMITLGGAFSYWFRGESAPAIEPPADRSRVPAAEVSATMDALLAAVQTPGALERTIEAPVGTMQGEVFARLVAFDGLVHGWDLATSTGQRYDPPTEVVAVVEEFARTAITPEMRDGEVFAQAQEAPQGASALERVVAFSGRSL